MRRALPKPTLVAAAISGDERALDAVVDACLPVVLQWCRRLGGAGVEPEDTAHDILVVLLEKIADLDNEQAFPAWLFQITRKTVAGRRRRAWLRRWIPGARYDTADHRTRPDRYQEMAEDVRRVQELLDQLPEAQRQVLILHDLEGRSDSEVAALLGVPKGTVKSRLRTARLRFMRSAVEQGVWPLTLSFSPAEGAL